MLTDDSKYGPEHTSQTGRATEHNRQQRQACLTILYYNTPLSTKLRKDQVSVRSVNIRRAAAAAKCASFKSAVVLRDKRQAYEGSEEVFLLGC